MRNSSSADAMKSPLSQLASKTNFFFSFSTGAATEAASGAVTGGDGWKNGSENWARQAAHEKSSKVTDRASTAKNLQRRNMCSSLSSVVLAKFADCSDYSISPIGNLRKRNERKKWPAHSLQIGILPR